MFLEAAGLTFDTSYCKLHHRVTYNSMSSTNVLDRRPLPCLCIVWCAQLSFTNAKIMYCLTIALGLDSAFYGGPELEGTVSFTTCREFFATCREICATYREFLATYRVSFFDLPWICLRLAPWIFCKKSQVAKMSRQIAKKFKVNRTNFTASRTNFTASRQKFTASRETDHPFRATIVCRVAG